MAPETAGISPALEWRAPHEPARGDGDPRSGSQAALLAIIQRTWAEVLDVEHVGPDDDFFDLGGDSLIAASAMALLGERAGIETPIRALLAAPTPAEMVVQIAELRARRAQEGSEEITPFVPDWVVPLQSRGAGRPVFLFPGGRGGKWMLVKDAQVACLVGRDHPFCGFRRDPPHLPQDREDWIEATVADYVAQMRAIQGRGPYLLYGVCSGGALAWETARQLIDRGEEIGGMLFYESPLPADFAERVSPRSRPARRIPGQVPAYLPEALVIDLTLLMTEAWQAKARSAGWHQVARGRIETVVMPGRTPGAHNLYFHREPMIAGHLRDWIAGSETRGRAP